jgi:hypothetical protein
VGLVFHSKTPINQLPNTGCCCLEDLGVTGQIVVQCYCQCWVDKLMDILHLVTTPLRKLTIHFVTVIDTWEQRNASPDLIMYHSISVAW